jgi:hypothetical protein
MLGSRERVSTVSVVGMPLAGAALPIGLSFAALGRSVTRVIAVAQASSLRLAEPALPETAEAISFCISQEQVAETVRFLHRELGLEDEGA